MDNMSNWHIIFNKYLLFKSCGDCVALQDPYCAWDIKTNSCQAYRPGQKEQLQNVNIGYHPQCPVPIEPTTTVSIFAQLRSFENVTIVNSYLIFYTKFYLGIQITKYVHNVCYEKFDTHLLLYTVANVYQIFRNRRYLDGTRNFYWLMHLNLSTSELQSSLALLSNLKKRSYIILNT